MVDGAASLMSIFYGMTAGGRWSDQRGDNLLDGGAPFYDTYETADGRYVSHRRARAEVLCRAGAAHRPGRALRASASTTARCGPRCATAIAAILRGKTRDEWCALLEGTDACFAPVLTIDEAPRMRMPRSRSAFVEVDGVVQPGARAALRPQHRRAAAPRRRPIGMHTDAVLSEAGFSADEIAALHAAGVALRP